MKTFQQFLEEKRIEEGLGTWMGQGVDAAARGLGRLGHAAASGLGAGTMAGMKRAGNVLMQGNAGNQAQKWGLDAQKAAMTGDPKQFVQVGKMILQQMQQAQQAQPQQMQQQGMQQQGMQQAQPQQMQQPAQGMQPQVA